MPTRPTGPTPSAATDGTSPFAGLGAGLGFFQDWMKAAGSALPHLQGQAAAAPSMPGMPAWSMPTLDPEELDKRIQELKTVQFWLEQNARMIAMTIQGLEVQKMTLSTLQGMNVSMDTLREGLKARVPDPTPPTPEAAEAGAATATGNEGDLINPMRWWDTLTQQFTHLASQATQTAQSVGETVEASMQDMVAKAQAAAAPAAAAAADAVKPRHAASTAPRKTPARKAPASKTAATAARKASPKA